MKPRYSCDQAKKYFAFANGSFSWHYLEKPALARFLKPLVSKQAKILDAGCGFGRSTQMLAGLGFAGKNITGVDISRELLEIAKDRLPKAKFVQTDLTKFHAPKASFNLIVSNMVLQYLDKDQYNTTTKKFFQWLKPDGHLLFITVHPLRFREHFLKYFLNKEETEHTPWGTKISYYPKTFSTYYNGLAKAGFTILKVDEPVPTKASKNQNPAEYKKYSSTPTRLLFLARK